MSSLSNKTIVVFGGTGFVGRHVVMRLARLGARVVVPTRDLEKTLPLKTAGDAGQIVALRGSLSDEALLHRAVEGAYGVINLIGILHESGRQKFAALHADFPAHLAKIAARAGVTSFVHVSAIGAGGHSSSRYAASKEEGEEGVRAAFPDATILRPSIIFGPEDHFFNRFADMALLAPALPLIGGGKTRFQPVYVGDVADAVVACLSFDAAKGKVFELAGPAILTFRELMQMMLKKMGCRRCLVSLPFWLASLKAFFLQMLPSPVLTVDQVRLLKQDNVMSPAAHGLRDIGITPTALETVLPRYLDTYRQGGRFSRL